MDINDYIVGIIMVAVYAICLMLKPLLKDNTKWLPLMAGILGFIFNAWYNMGISFSIFVTGIVSGLAATGADQVWKQSSGYYDADSNRPEVTD